MAAILHRKRVGRWDDPTNPTPTYQPQASLAFTRWERAALKDILQAFLDVDEPEAMLTLLRHVAERKALGGVQGLIGVEESQRWMALADALRAAEGVMRVPRTA